MASFDPHSNASMNTTDSNDKESMVKLRAVADVNWKVGDGAAWTNASWLDGPLPAKHSKHDPQSPLLDHDHKILASPGICTSCRLDQQPPSPQLECCPHHYLVHHSPMDACCGNFCPDIEVPHEHPCCGGEWCHHHHPQDRPYRRRHRRHSLLNQQQWPELLEEKAESNLLPIVVRNSHTKSMGVFVHCSLSKNNSHEETDSAAGGRNETVENGVIEKGEDLGDVKTATDEAHLQNIYKKLKVILQAQTH